MVNEEQDIPIVIKRVYEKNKQLRVIITTPYGEDNIGLSLQSQNLDPITQQPKFLQEVKNLVEKKYLQINATEKEILPEIHGKSIMLSEIENCKNACGFVKRLISIGLTNTKAEEVLKKYPDHCELRKDVLSQVKLPFDDETNDILTDYYGGDNLGFTKQEYKSKEEKFKQSLSKTTV